MLREPVALIAVIGPASHDLVPAFCEHYRALGVSEFRIAVHIPEGAQTASSERLIDTIRVATGGPPELVSRGAWRVETNGLLRDELRDRALADWHLLADADEFQFHAGGLEATLAACKGGAAPFATGVMVDRLPSGAELPPAGGRPRELDRSFPLGCFLTAALLDGDPRKITVARRDVAIGSPGNHFVEGESELDAPAPLPVHHFKWHQGVSDYLAHRARAFAASPLHSELGVRREALRAVELLASGVSAVTAGVRTFGASLTELPARWEETSAPIWRYWQTERRLARISGS
jgi:hypothetical protein